MRALLLMLLAVEPHPDVKAAAQDAGWSIDDFRTADRPIWPELTSFVVSPRLDGGWWSVECWPSPRSPQVRQTDAGVELRCEPARKGKQ